MKPIKNVRQFRLIASIAALSLTACASFEVAHVPPGQSVRDAAPASSATPAPTNDLPSPAPATPAPTGNATEPPAGQASPAPAAIAPNPPTQQEAPAAPAGPSASQAGRAKAVIAHLAKPSVQPAIPANENHTHLAKPSEPPAGNNGSESVADIYTRGNFAMQAGQNTEAIVAFQEALKLDPDFTDAWGKLALLYQKEGNSAKAVEAFKKAKRLGDANGGTVTRDASGGLQFP